MKIVGTDSLGLLPPDKFDPDHDFFDADEIKDGSIRHCCCGSCINQASHFFTAQCGLHKLNVTVCEQHYQEIYQGVNNVHRSPSNPEAEVVLERQGDRYLWVVLCCPICGRRHEHGAGSVDGNPRDLLGHRVAHCHDPFAKVASELGGYVLVEKEEGTDE